MEGIRHKRSTSATIVKAMGLFTGVKSVTILCSLIRNKLIAWLIGPAGLGLVILYNSIVDLTGTATRLSMDQSAQRDLSQASGHNVDVTVTVVRRWSIWLGIAGAAVMAALSPLLSYLSFDTAARWPLFCLLAIVPFCLTVANCSIATNQGLRRLRAVAAGTVIGALLGLAAAVPLVIFLRIDSIVWIIVAYGIATLAGAMLYRYRPKPVDMTYGQVVAQGKSFIRLGAQITFAMFVSQIFSYGFVLYLNRTASTSVLGTYQAGYTLLNTYVGVIFTGIWMEYYPRLAAIAHSRRRINIASSHEVSVAMIVLMPILSGFIAFAGPIVRIIYASDFLTVIPFITIGSLGIILRATSWCQAFIILAKGDGKAYILSEGLSAMLSLALNIAGYHFGGFAGLGISYIVWYGLYSAIIAIICHRRYNVAYTGRALALIGCTLAVTATALTGYMLWGPIIPVVICILSGLVSFRVLSHKIL